MALIFGTAHPADLGGARALAQHVGDERDFSAFPTGQHVLQRAVSDPPCAIGPTLKERGLIFVGIDIIGGYMTEINVTSPTGLQEIARFDEVNLEAMIWDAIEARL
mgnify:CR=1 FL=1